MNITALVQKDDQTYQFTTEVNTEQMRFLLEHAVRDLIMRGILPLEVPGTDADKPESVN